MVIDLKSSLHFYTPFSTYHQTLDWRKSCRQLLVSLLDKLFSPHGPHSYIWEVLLSLPFLILCSRSHFYYRDAPCNYKYTHISIYIYVVCAILSKTFICAFWNLLLFFVIANFLNSWPPLCHILSQWRWARVTVSSTCSVLCIVHVLLGVL